MELYFTIELEIDFGLNVLVMDLDKTKDWLLRRLRGLGIDGKKDFELLKVYDMWYFEFMFWGFADILVLFIYTGLIAIKLIIIWGFIEIS